MRIVTKEYTVYNYHELDVRAQERAQQEWRQSTEYFRGKDNEDSLKAFCGIAPVKVTDWNYGSRDDVINFRLCLDYPEVEDFTGIRLLRWLENNLIWALFVKGKYISKRFDGAYKHRYSKVLFSEPEYALTGYHMDYALIKPILDFRKTPSDKITLRDLINDCLWSWVYACRDDMEYSQSEECFIEECAANSYECTEGGRQFFE